jgi:RNA polymerase sigma-70 factor (sigma-E family)
MTRDAEFAEFVSARYRLLVRYGVSLVADVGKAEDLAQIALLKTYRAWPRLDRGSPDAYTRRVMARAAWRAGRRRWRLEVPTPNLPERATADQYGEVDLGDLVRRALRTLPAGQRVVLTLRFLDGLTEVETAELLGCAQGTVKSRCSRGLATLRTMGLLNDEEQPSRQERKGAR